MPNERIAAEERPPMGESVAYDSNGDPGDESSTGTPRWVKVLGAIAILLVVLVVVVMITGVGGDHGPGRHLGGGDGADRRTPPSHAPQGRTPRAGADKRGGHTPPPGVEHGPRRP